MARTNNLSNFLTDVAGAIRTKKGSEEPIAAADFDTEIENLPSGGGADLSEYFNNTITENPTASTQFELIKKLPVINVDNNVTSLSYLFRNYTALGGVPNTAPKIICGNNITDLSYMFSAQNREYNLKAVDLSGINDTNVTTMYQMFNNRSGLLEVDMSNFTGQSLSSNYALNATFYLCQALTKVNLSNFAPQEAIDCRKAFYNCYKLEELDIDKWDLATYSPNQTSSMFTSCGVQLASGTYTKIYVKDQAAQNWILALSSSDRPSTWTTDNVIIAGSEADLRNA